MELITSKIENFLSSGYHEPRAADYFMIGVSKWNLASFLFVYLFIAAKMGPILSSMGSSFNLRPWMLVLNGLNFGVYGIAIPILGWLTSFGVTCWDCDEPKEGAFIEETLLRLSYTYLWMKVADCMSTLVMLLRSKSGQNPLYHALRNSCLILVVYSALRMYARGSILFLPFTDAILSVIRSAYYVLASPGDAFRHHLWFKNYIHYVALLFAALNGAHMVSQLSSSCAGPIGMKLLVLVHSFGEAYVALKELSKPNKQTEMEEDERPSKKSL